ncbi:hypothetical protein [Cerasicoccus fimbriatus]|uniref:hypothetical protein n=1 Tax=Cerasicoccus fimbriatus TaxID=3014554 RepID=UPI0022B31A2A|nr:hypothetical protein [Cerasicoccus sp. TK19100]
MRAVPYRAAQALGNFSNFKHLQVVMGEGIHDSSRSETVSNELGKFKISKDGLYLVGDTESYRLSDISGVQAIQDDGSKRVLPSMIMHTLSFLPLLFMSGGVGWLPVIGINFCVIDLHNRRTHRVMALIQGRKVELYRVAMAPGGGIKAFFTRRKPEDLCDFNLCMEFKYKLEAALQKHSSGSVLSGPSLGVAE